MVYQTLSFLLLLFTFSCGGTAKVADGNQSEISTTPTDEIVFVVFRMQKASPKNQIEWVSTAKSYGKIKGEINRSVDPANALTLEISQQGKPIKTMIVEHPLHKIVEYPDDNNRYQSQWVEPEEGEFFIRFQKKVGNATIKVIENLNNTKTELQTFTL